MTKAAEARVKLSQHESLMIEALRGLGWSDDEIIARVRSRELPIDNSEFQFDYSELSDFDAGQPMLFESALRNGYQMKFNTLGGIRCWISIKLDKEPEVSRVPGEESVTIALTEAEKNQLISVLSIGWTVAAASDGDGNTANNSAINAEMQSDVNTQNFKVTQTAADSLTLYKIVPTQRV